MIDAKTELLAGSTRRRRGAVFAGAETLAAPPGKACITSGWPSARRPDRRARRAGFELGWSRRLHMLAALLFYLGLIAHVVVVLFFAGYAADGGHRLVVHHRLGGK